MSEYILSACSPADLSKQHMDSRDIKYICFHYSLGDKEYKDDLWQTMTPDEFYNRMLDGEDTKTSQISVSEYIDYFEGFLSQGKDILHCSLSSGLSGSYNSARNAAILLQPKYPDRKIIIVDTLCASSGYGLFMDKLADLRDQGFSIDELQEWAENNKLHLNHWFFSTDLTFYIKGGRVSKAAGFFGGMLGICPLLHVDNLGRLIPVKKVPLKANAIRETLKKMEHHAYNGKDYSDKVYICHSECLEDAEKLARMVEKEFPRMNGKVLINDIGSTIGSHTGPGTIALFFWGLER